MNLFENTKRLAKEVFSLKKYKMMKLPLAIVVGILMSPVAVVFLSYLGLLFVFTIVYGLLESPIKVLHKVVKDEAKEMSRVTEVVIYILSWPTLFTLYFIYIFFAMWIYFFYFFTALLGYIVSLCGIKFHISIVEENIAIEDVGRTYNKEAIIYICVHGTALLALIIIGIITFVNLYANYQEAEFWVTFSGTLLLISGLMQFFTVVFVPIAFNNMPKKEKPAKVKKLPKEKKEKEPKEEEPKDEEKAE